MDRTHFMDRGHFAGCYGSRPFCRVLWIEVILLWIEAILHDRRATPPPDHFRAGRR